jgi:DNA-binding IclR family transcriptional regulator
VRAVQRAFELLALVGGQRTPTTLSEFSRNSALPLSTVARLLATLEQCGFVRRDGDGGYGPGTRLLQVGLGCLSSISIYDLSEPHLRRLSEASGETANLAVRADAENAIYIRQVVSLHSIRHAYWLGRMLPLSKTAIGNALLGKAGASGYVARRNTLEPDVTAVAAPIRGPGGEIVGALSITGPTFRITDKHLARFGRLLLEEARLVSAKLGSSALKKGV